ncbi:MAG: protein kinase [Acidimicrobiaceae bacterium]|nr:protein kinase [Acidimicrobiaceae bacterium]
MSSIHRKVAPVGRAGHERTVLRLVQGPGVVPTPTAALQGANADPAVVETIAGNGSLADVLAERGRLSETECRAIASRVAAALGAIHERGIVHGDIKPANIVMAPDGDLWIADFDAAGSPSSARLRGTPQRLRNHGTLDRSDDFVGVALLVAECATGILIDPTAEWTASALTQLGCGSELAHDLAAALADPGDPRRVASLLGSSTDALPRAAKLRAGADPSPTVDFEPTAIAGLDPLPTAAEAFPQPSTPVGRQQAIQRTLSESLTWLRNKWTRLSGWLRGRGG